MGGKKLSKEIKAAIKANDYTAFVKAWNEVQASLTVPTKAEFEAKAKMFLSHQAIETAVLANNYDAYKTAFAAMPLHTGNNKMPALVPLEQFPKKVAMTKAHAAVEAALLANNYEAFKTALAALPKPGTGTDTRPTPPVPAATEFATMAAMANKRAAVEATFKANDYTAFVAAWTTAKPTVPTQEEFTKIVSKHGEIKEDRKSGDKVELKKDRKERNGMVKNKLKAKMDAMKEKRKKK
jgi:hypothetical protein